MATPKRDINVKSPKFILFIIVVVALFAVWFYYGRTTTVNINSMNRCSNYKSDGSRISTAAAGKAIYKEIPNSEVDRYIAEERSKGKCIDKTFRFIKPTKLY